MMSSMKIQCPPQTYSRLFRPWDMAQRIVTTNNNNITSSQPTTATNAPTQKAVVNAPKALASVEQRAVPENLIIKGNENKIRANNCNPSTTKGTIKVEIVKIESADSMDVVEAEDEEIEVEYDDDDVEDYLHTSRASDCASSQSNFSQLSDDTERRQDEKRRRLNATTTTKEGRKSFAETKSPMQQINNANSYAAVPSQLHPHHIAAKTHHNHHQQIPPRTAFDAYHQHHLHLLTQPKTTPTNPTVAASLQSLSTASAPLSSDYMYGAAAAAAAALNRTCDVLPPAATSASLFSGLPATAASFVGMDAYTFGLMEQEYARIMAEEAHLKAVNARKQRPKKFKCPHCDVAFSNNGQLKGHIRIHTGERPYKCDVESCGKTFTRNEELTRHKRIHTGLRPYPCAACGKKFGRRDHLKKHMKTHMPQERQLGPAIFVPMYPYLYGY